MSASHSPDSPIGSQTLLDLLQRQQSLVDQLAAMAQSQSTLIAQGSTDRLLDLLSQRQIIIDQFTATQTQLGEMTQTLDRHMDRASNPQQEQIKRLMGDIGEQLTQIMRCDERDQAALCTSRDQIKQELSTMGTARQARSAYRPAVQDTRFADRRG